MSQPIDMAAIHALPIEERIELANTILDQVEQEVENTPLSPAWVAEIERRLERLRTHPEASVPWEEVEAAALARLKK